MTRKRNSIIVMLIGALVIVAGAVGGAYALRFGARSDLRPAPPPPAPAAQTSEAPQTASVNAAPVAPRSVARPTARGPLPAEQPLSAEAYQELRRCLPDSEKPANLTEMMGEFKAAYGGITSRRVQTTNLHIQLPNGEIRRLQAAGGKFRLFAEDAEGLPVPLEVPDELKNLPPEEALRRYAARGQKVFEDVEATVEFKSGAAANVTEDGGIPIQLHLFMKNRSFGCAYDEAEKVTDCQCIFPDR